jgi:hypothetical protein
MTRSLSVICLCVISERNRLTSETKREMVRPMRVRVERVLLGGLMSAVAFLLDRRLRKLQS